jgi:hypothetical protein
MDITGSTRRMDITGAGDPEQTAGAMVTAGFSPAMRTPPLLGRVFRAGEDDPGCAPIAILGESLWRRRFAASPAALGQIISGARGRAVRHLEYDPPAGRPHRRRRNCNWAARLALTRLLETFLFGASTTDPLTFIAVAAALLSVALIAAFVPARRATKISPLLALR